MDHLFIKYVNADLEKHPEDILMVLEAAIKFNQENAGPQDPYHQNIHFFPLDVFSKVENICKILHSDINSSYPYVYARSEINAFTEEFKRGFTPVDGDTRLIALDGSIFWAAHNDGCHGCNFNQVYERDKVCGADETEITCLVCDQRFFKAALYQIINGSLDALVPFQEAAGRIIKTGHLPEGTTLKACSWVDPYLMTFEPNRQQFSTFIMGIVGHNLISFLNQDSTNKNRIGVCRVCKRFFVAHRLGMVNCQSCKNKLPTDIATAKQQRIRKDARDREIRKKKLERQKREQERHEKEMAKQEIITAYLKKGYSKEAAEAYAEIELR
jgi:hypothetical protein